MMRALLGDRAQQQGLELYDGVARTHDHVTNLNVGASLGYHLMTNMMRSNVSIATLLPAQEINPAVTYFTWTVEYANPGVAPHVPEEAPFYEIGFATEQRQAKLERRGIGIRMTANVMATEEGMARLRAQLVKLAATMLITIEYVTLRALVTAHDGPLYRRKITLDRYSVGELEQRLDYDAAHFGSWARNPDTEASMDMSDMSKLLNEYASGPYAVLYPAGKASMMGGRVLDSPTGLDIQVLDLDKNIMQMKSPVSNIRLADGSLAFPVPDYGILDSGAREQPLLRTRVIAEHMSMSGIPCDDISYRVGVQIPGGGFATCVRDRHPYDTGVDEYVRVSWADAFRHSRFVPERAGEPDLIEDFVNGDARPNEAAFTSRHRSAPSRTYFNAGVRRVRIFGEFDKNVVSPKTHRQVGATIAAIIHKVEGSEVASDFAAGMQLVRDLANAPPSAAFKQLFAGFFAPNGGVALGAQAPDLAALGVGASVYPQNPDGTPPLSPEEMDSLAEAINTNGTPPFLFNLGGIRLLANMAERMASVEGLARDLSNRAKNLIDVSERIYSILLDKFPDAVALNPAYRPLNYFPADGFATFFTNVILNSGNAPVLLNDIVTPFTWTTRTMSERDGRWKIGSRDNPLRPAAPGQPETDLRAQSRLTPSHMRTSWAAQHFPVAASQQRRQGGQGRSARVVSGIQGSEDDDEDLFGTAPSFRSAASRSSVMMAGAPVQTETTAIGIRQYRGLNNPMTSQNAQDAWDAADKIDDPLIRICTMTYVTAYCETMEAYDRMMESDILVPFDLILIRPAVQNNMYSLLGLQPGVQTGSNLISQTKLDFGKNVDHQTRRLTFSIIHNAIVVSPDNVAILTDRIPRQYLGGGGVRFFKDPSEFELPSRDRPDFIVMVVPMGHKVERREPMGGIDVDGLYGAKGSSRFPDARYYERIWHLSEQSVRSRNMRSGYDDSSQAFPNYSWTAESLNWNQQKICRAKGHRRGGSHPGCLDVWNGNKSIFPPPPELAYE